MNEIEHRPRFFGVERFFQDPWPSMAQEVLTGPLLRGGTGQPLTREEIMQLPRSRVAEISDVLGLRLQKSSEMWTSEYRVTRQTPLGQRTLIANIAAENGGIALRMAIAKLREDVLLRQRQQQPLEIHEDTLRIQYHRSRGLACLLPLFFGERYEASVYTSKGWQQVLNGRFKSWEAVQEMAIRRMALLNQARNQQ